MRAKVVMNLVDVALAIVIVLSIWGGWVRGFVVTAAGLFALLASLVLAFLIYPFGVALAERVGIAWGVWTAPLAFLIAYVLVRIVVGLVLYRIVSAVPRAAHAHGVNRTLGLIPGAGNGLINATIVSMLLLALPLSDGINRTVRESGFVNGFAAPAEWLEARLRPVFEPALDRTLTTITVPPGSRERVDLPFKVQDPKQRPELEARMLELLNEERRAQGLPLLQADPEVAEVARAHSREMFARGYFSHVTPEGEDPFDRMREAGLRFRAAGENLALARSLPMAHRGLMDSPGHRANILRPQFGRVGIGILDGGRYGLMVTQKFRN